LPLNPTNPKFKSTTLIHALVVLLLTIQKYHQIHSSSSI